jgi:hypothetical protein
LSKNPDPVTVTDWPFASAVLGVATIDGPAADALVTPSVANPPTINAPIAILVINRLIVYVLPIAVVTISLYEIPR